ncbi:MAG: AbrB family transcriptional regulator [Candidatus Edwardsbacteria bacterium]|nr:AbrB family transcriptional regulator [Candidatus Edwardsbacteria bacterium]MBU2595019.1 AbrB family transcriptional regulator [Candidatus Edwardsbacteria bacterium]
MTEQTIKSDQRGRICLGKKIVDMYGKDFTLITSASEIILLPAISDPIGELQEQGKKLPKKATIKQLRQEIIDQCLKDMA